MHWLMLSAVVKKPLCQTKWLKRNNFSSGKNWKDGVDIMVTHNEYWFSKMKQNSANTKKVRHYKLFY